MPMSLLVGRERHRPGKPKGRPKLSEKFLFIVLMNNSRQHLNSPLTQEVSNDNFPLFRLFPYNFEIFKFLEKFFYPCFSGTSARSDTSVSLCDMSMSLLVCRERHRPGKPKGSPKLSGGLVVYHFAKQSPITIHPLTQHSFQ